MAKVASMRIKATTAAALPSYLVSGLDTAITNGLVQPMIVVFPNGGQNSHYMNAQPGTPAFVSSYMVEESLIGELIPYIEANYRTCGTQGGRAIQGFSMGGQGCDSPAIDDVASTFTGCPSGCTAVLTSEPALMANL